MKNTKFKILAISGSTRASSSNLHILKAIADLFEAELEVQIYNELASLPHFNPDLDNETPPTSITAFRQLATQADGVIICTPEYVFSLPGSLKNALEWMVSTTIFTDKPAALITASASGLKAHESLQLVMKTIGAVTDEKMQVLIQGVKGKMNAEGQITDEATLESIKSVVQAFIDLLQNHTLKDEAKTVVGKV